MNNYRKPHVSKKHAIPPDICAERRKKRMDRVAMEMAREGIAEYERNRALANGEATDDAKT